jgi:hypothetical protein
MTPIEQIKELIHLAERAFAQVAELDDSNFEEASEIYFDAIACQIHKIVKQHGLQKEYEELSNCTIFEYHAELWLAKNPFNPETNPSVNC